MPTLAELRAAFAKHEPQLRSAQRRRQAAVALVLRETPADVELLFIERAQRRDDPWSGHMAFPGGFVDGADADARSAAERETREEVGLDLAPAEIVGRLDDVEGAPSGRAELVVSAFVYVTDGAASLRLNHEVREALWVPLTTLVDPASAVPYERAAGGTFPGIRVGAGSGQVVWGLTYHFVSSFLDVLRLELPGGGTRSAR